MQVDTFRFTLIQLRSSIDELRYTLDAPQMQIRYNLDATQMNVDVILMKLDATDKLRCNLDELKCYLYEVRCNLDELRSNLDATYM